MSMILGIAGKALIGLLMSLATEAFFRDIFIMLATQAAKSSKTKWDDELVENIKKHLGE